MKYLIGLTLVSGQFMTFMASDPTGLGGISAGALVGIAGTWIAIVGGYFHIRRTLVQDREASIKRIAEAVVRAELAVRGPTFMDRSEQDRINEQNTERYQTLTRLIERAMDKEGRGGMVVRDGR